MLEESEEKAFFFCHKSCLSFGPKIVKGPELHRRRLDLVWQNQMLKSQLVSGPTNKMLFSTFCSLPLLPLQGYGEQLHLLFFFWVHSDLDLKVPAISVRKTLLADFLFPTPSSISVPALSGFLYRSVWNFCRNLLSS